MLKFMVIVLLLFFFWPIWLVLGILALWAVIGLIIGGVATALLIYMNQDPLTSLGLGALTTIAW